VPTFRALPVEVDTLPPSLVGRLSTKSLCHPTALSVWREFSRAPDSHSHPYDTGVMSASAHASGGDGIARPEFTIKYNSLTGRHWRLHQFLV